MKRLAEVLCCGPEINSVLVRRGGEGEMETKGDKLIIIAFQRHPVTLDAAAAFSPSHSLSSLFPSPFFPFPPRLALLLPPSLSPHPPSFSTPLSLSPRVLVFSGSCLTGLTQGKRTGVWLGLNGFGSGNMG